MVLINIFQVVYILYFVPTASAYDSQSRHVSGMRDYNGLRTTGPGRGCLIPGTRYNIQRMFTKLRNSTPWLQKVGRIRTRQSTRPARQRMSPASMETAKVPPTEERQHQGGGMACSHVSWTMVCRCPVQTSYGRMSSSHANTSLTGCTAVPVGGCGSASDPVTTYTGCTLRIMRRSAADVAAGIDRGTANPTAVCKTDHVSHHSMRHCDDVRREPEMGLWGRTSNKHSGPTREMRQKCNQGSANDREYV